MSGKEWYYTDGEEQQGPVSRTELRHLLQSGQVSKDHYAWREGLPEWVPVSQVLKRSRQNLPTADSGRGPSKAPDTRPEPSRDDLSSQQKAVVQQTQLRATPVPHGLNSIVDVRPVIPRTGDNVIQKLECERDRIFNDFVSVCRDLNVEAVVLRSEPYRSVWVSFECWVPHESAPNLTDRSLVTLKFKPRPYHRFEYETDVTLVDGNRTRMYLGVVDIQMTHISALVKHMLRRTGTRRPNIGFRRVRQFGLQFWRPKNKVTQLKTDIVQVVKQTLLLSGLILLAVGIGVLLLILGGALAAWDYYFRPGYVLSCGKPQSEPRSLRAFEYWRTLIPGLASRADEVRSDVLAELQSRVDESIKVNDEKIWYWGLDHIVDRDQFVASLRRTVGFIHVYAYADDLYVAWDTHLNLATWKEKQVATGIDRKSGEVVRVQTIEEAVQPVNEYDFADCSCLSEWIHSALRHVVKRYAEEAKIDFELDFSIKQRDSDSSSDSASGTSGSRSRGGLLSRARSMFERQA